MIAGVVPRVVVVNWFRRMRGSAPSGSSAPLTRWERSCWAPSHCSSSAQDSAGGACGSSSAIAVIVLLVLPNALVIPPYTGGDGAAARRRRRYRGRGAGCTRGERAGGPRSRGRSARRYGRRRSRSSSSRSCSRTTAEAGCRSTCRSTTEREGVRDGDRRRGSEHVRHLRRGSPTPSGASWPERISERGSWASFTMLMGTALALGFQFVAHPAVAVGYGILLGIAARGEGSILMILIANYYGRRSYGAISGLVQTALLVGLALGPFIMSVIRESTGSYLAVFYSAARNLHHRSRTAGAGCEAEAPAADDQRRSHNRREPAAMTTSTEIEALKRQVADSSHVLDHQGLVDYHGTRERARAGHERALHQAGAAPAQPDTRPRTSSRSTSTPISKGGDSQWNPSDQRGRTITEPVPPRETALHAAIMRAKAGRELRGAHAPDGRDGDRRGGTSPLRRSRTRAFRSRPRRLSTRDPTSSRRLRWARRSRRRSATALLRCCAITASWWWASRWTTRCRTRSTWSARPSRRSSQPSWGRRRR